MNNIDIALREIKKFSDSEIVDYEPLNGGLSNVTYKIKTKNNFYVLRINGKQNEYLNLSREEEQAVIIKAANLGVAPKIFLLEDNSNFLISEFIEGKPLGIEDMHNIDSIKKVTKTLLKIHSIEGIERKCSPFDLIRKYLNGAQELNIKLPDNLNKHLKRMNVIESYRSNDKDNTNKYCHNDYHTGYNMISNGERLTVIDWELSGIGDIFFDLATISSDNKFAFEEDKILLENYFGEFKNEQFDILNDMKFVCMLREVAWALMHEGMNINKVNHDMNYYEFALQVLEGLDNGIVTL